MSWRKLSSLICVSAPLIAGTALGRELDPRPFWYNRGGIAAIEKEDGAAAGLSLGEALRYAPLRGEIHYNFGLSFIARKESAKALESMRLALEYAKNDEIRFKARFAMGVILGAEKKFDEALEQYQEALHIWPSSRETKINIELLVARRDQDQQQKEQQQKEQQNQDQKDQKDQKDGQGKDDKNPQKPEDQNGKGEQENKDPNDKGKQAKPGDYEKPKPQDFKSQELTPSDVNKILDEIRQQEQRIRAEFQRKEMKERPREKPW